MIGHTGKTPDEIQFELNKRKAFRDEKFKSRYVLDPKYKNPNPKNGNHTNTVNYVNSPDD